MLAIAASSIALLSGATLLLAFEPPLVATIFLASAMAAIGGFVLAGIAAYLAPPGSN